LLATMLHELKRRAMQNPDDADARYALAEALFGEKQYEAASKQLEKALALAPDHASVRLLLARAYQRDGRMTLAERTLEQQVERHPDSAAARDELAELLVEAGRVDDALVHLEEAIRVDPANFSRRVLAADLAIRRRLFARARGHLEHARQLAPGDATIAERLEAVRIELGEAVSRPSALERGTDFLAGRVHATLETEPLRGALAGGALKQASAALRQRDLAAAKRALVTATGQEQAGFAFAFLRGELLLLSGDRDRAEQAYQRAVERCGSLGHAHGRLGELCAAAGRHREALDWYERWLRFAPDNADALEGVGDALAAMGRREQALPRYERALAIRPDPALMNKIAAQQAGMRSPSAQDEACGRIGALGWNATGGIVSIVEAAAVPGRGELIFTGNVGPSGQDAAKVAFSCLKARAESFGIAEAIQRLDLHLHFVDTELAKDGPSAGLALALAGLSALTRRKMRPDLAATGEITLQGAVRTVGGLHEKLVASYLAGIRTVLVPRKNLFDARSLPREVVSRMELIYVDSLAEAAASVLAGGQEER
jgi:ATP-dependent Lon protease